MDGGNNQRYSKFMKKLFYLSIIILVGSLFLNSLNNKNQPQLFVLNVGQGSASLIITPDGKNVLIDGGPDAKVLTELGKIMPFYDRVIDLLIITHSHDDHVGGLIDVFERYDVKTVVYTGVVDDTKIYQRLLEAIKNEQAKVIGAVAGQEFCFPSVSADKDEFSCQLNMKILYPINSLANKEIENPNDGSVVMLIEHGRNKIVVTGDLEIKGESEVVDAWQNKINFSDEDEVVYLVGHHGSNTSSSKKFLDFIKPDYSIISVGKKNKFNHPSLIITERLKVRSKQVWRTDEAGSIKVLIKNNNWVVTPFKLNFLDLFK